MPGPLEPNAVPDAAPRDLHQATGSRDLLQRLRRIDRILLVTVIVPTLLALTYYGLLASDVYVSESRFIVRGHQQATPSGLLGTLLQGTSLSRSLDDTHAVHDFILSRDALREVDGQLHLAQAFKSHDIDFIDRFGAFGFSDGFEALHRYYQRRVSVDVDTGSSIAVLRVSAFSADDARSLNEAILAMSERFVNQLSERARKDIVRFAATEVADAEQRAQRAAASLAAYRSETSVMDPERQSAVQIARIEKIEEQITLTRTELAQLMSSSPQNPQIPSLRIRKSTLEHEVNEELARITGGGGSLSAKATGYMRVALEREFAEKQLGAAMAFLENARNEAQRQQLYLERIVQPNHPDEAVEPRRIRSIVVVFVLGVMAWGILSLLLAGVREHRQ